MIPFSNRSADGSLERTGLRFVRAHDQLVEAGLADDGGVLRATKGGNPFYPLLVVPQLFADHLVAISGVAHGIQGIGRDEPWLALDLDDANGVVPYVGVELEVDRGGVHEVILSVSVRSDWC